MMTPFYTILALGCTLGLALCLRAMICLHPRPRKGIDDAAGVATIEFALVMPIILFLVLVLMQTALLMAGQLYVQYAAFAAARVAIVQIPRDLSAVGGEGPNVIDPDPDSHKFAAITRAAQLAVMPVSGRDESSQVDELAYADALREHFERRQRPVPRWAETLAAERLAYAVEHTEVEVLYADGKELEPTNRHHNYDQRHTVGVRVMHRFNLSVPYVRAIFADDYHDTKHGETAYTDVVATAVLTIEGTDTGFPVKPTLPRRDLHRINTP